MKIRSLLTATGLGLILIGLTALSLAEPAPSRGGYPPDPPGIATKKQWSFEIEYRDGKVRVRKVEALYLQNPAATARVMGRFAVEFWVGKELLDRVRFEVPLLDEPSLHRKGALSGPRFGDVSTRLRVRLADNPRATFVALVDRSTGAVTRFSWPPQADGSLSPLAPQKATAGVEADAGDGGGAPQDAEIPRDSGDGGP